MKKINFIVMALVGTAFVACSPAETSSLDKLKKDKQELKASIF